MNVRVNGKQENQIGNGLEVLCLATIKVLEHMYFKVRPYFKKN